MKGQPFFKRLQFALHGLHLALLREMSFRVQVVVAIGVLAVLWIAGASPLWWAIGSLAIGLVMVAELANTALETLLDRLHPERHPEIRAAKDIAAGAVLLASAMALLIAIAFCFDQGWFQLH